MRLVRRARLLAAGILAIVALAETAESAGVSPSPDARAWWSHVQVLAADSLRGRMTGTEDYARSARYVATRFREFGAIPGGTSPRRTGADAYFQEVPFVWRRLREANCTVALERGGVALPFVLGRDGTLSAAVESADTLDAPLVFVGYGLAVPEAHYSDLAGLDLRGKLAVYFRAGPDRLPATLCAHAQAPDVRWAGLRAAGAVGFIAVNPMSRRGRGGSPPSTNRRQPGISIDDARLDALAGARFNMRLSPGYLDSLLVGSGHTAEELFALSDAHARLPVFPLGVRLRASVRFDRRRVTSPNVVAIIPGSDPRLRSQCVVVSAHLDHLGVGEPVHGDSIYNGAMDNASGIASLIEFARRARSTKSPFRRSVVLLALTGEEEGLLGSRWYASRPTVPVGSIVADINLDMFLPIVPMRSITAYGRQESDLGARFTAVAANAGVAVEDDPAPQRNYFIRSDQYSFIRNGVPSLFFEIGAGADTVAAAKIAAWNRDHYHDVSDDLSQPVDLEVAAAFTRLLYDFTREVANAPAPPRWSATSFFRRFSAPGSASRARAPAGRVLSAPLSRFQDPSPPR